MSYDNGHCVENLIKNVYMVMSNFRCIRSAHKCPQGTIKKSYISLFNLNSNLIAGDYLRAISDTCMNIMGIEKVRATKHQLSLGLEINTQR